jgi:hypothetical protein
MSPDVKTDYQIISGGMEVETWTPESPCYCSDNDWDLEPVPVPVDDLAKAIALAILLIVLICDDAIGGEADDVAIPEVIKQLARQLGPLVLPTLSVGPAL